MSLTSVTATPERATTPAPEVEVGTGNQPPARRFEGSGGYVYDQFPDGRIVIVGGPSGAGLSLTAGPAWEAITAEIAEGLGPLTEGDATTALADVDVDGSGGTTAAQDPGVSEAVSDDALVAPETDNEQTLAAFFDAFNGVPVRVNPGEEPAQYVNVIPPYHINRGDRKTDAESARADNAAVQAVIAETLDGYGTQGKATPTDIRTFLEACIARGLCADLTSDGLRDFLALYGISTDCSGFVSQALNHLTDGDMERDGEDPFDAMFVGSGSLRGGQGDFAAVGTPAELRAGDTMHIPGHIRILIDVDTVGGTIVFRTAESTANRTVVEPGERDAHAGIGDAHWRYADGARFTGLERSTDGGGTWAASSESPTYGRWTGMPADQPLVAATDGQVADAARTPGPDDGLRGGPTPTPGPDDGLRGGPPAAVETSAPTADDPWWARIDDWAVDVWDDAVEGMGNAWDAVTDTASDLGDTVAGWFGWGSDEASAPASTPATAGAERGEARTPEAERAADAHGRDEVTATSETPTHPRAKVVDGQAWTRTAPPELASTGETLARDSWVEVLEMQSHNNRPYARVQPLDAEGRPQGEPVWTWEPNLASAKEFDEELASEDEIALDGLQGLDRDMAEVHNLWGGYLATAAQRMGVEVGALAAIVHVESAGRGFSANGDMIIRFENHVFWRRWGSDNADTFNAHFDFRRDDDPWTRHRFREDASGSWDSFHGDQVSEWEVFEFARELNEEAAMMSISVGASQVMGFNWENLGYDNVQELFDEAQESIGGQLEAMVRFIENTPGCLRGLQNLDWVEAARYYNGSGQAETYGGRIRNAYNAWGRVVS